MEIASSNSEVQTYRIEKIASQETERLGDRRPVEDQSVASVCWAAPTQTKRLPIGSRCLLTMHGLEPTSSMTSIATLTRG